MGICKKIICKKYDDEKVIIGTYDSITDACRELNILRLSIFNNLTGITKKVKCPKLNCDVFFLYA